MKEREVCLGSGMESCGHVGTGMGQQPPHTSGIPESVDSHSGIHLQLQCSGPDSDSGSVVPVGEGTQGCGCTQHWSWAQGCPA